MYDGSVRTVPGIFMFFYMVPDSHSVGKFEPALRTVYLYPGGETTIFEQLSMRSVFLRVALNEMAL